MNGSSRFLLTTALVTIMTVGGVAVASAQTTLTLDTITVLITKARQRAIDALAGVSTVQGEQIALIQPSRIQELFNTTPGVIPVVNTDDPGIGFNIRGLQDYGRVAVVVDGARQNFEIAQHGPQGKTYLDPELISQAEIARGPVSNIYGSGAIGGVVSLTTKGVDDILTEDQSFGSELHGLVGSNGGPLAGSAFVAARPTQDFDIIVGVSHRTLGDYKDGAGNTIVNSGSESTSGLAKARLRPAEGHEIELGGIFQAFTFNSGNPTDVDAPLEYADTVNTSTLTGKYSFASPDNPLIDFNASGFWNHGAARNVVTLEYCAFFGPPPCRTFTGPVDTTTGYDLNTFGFDVHNAARFDALGLQNTLTVGADAFADDVESVGSLTIPDASYKMTASGKRLAYGAFAQLLAAYGTFVDVIGALRFDGYKSESASYTSDGARVSPKLTVGLTPIEGFTVYGTYAEGYRAPSINEAFVTSQHPGRIFRFLPNPALKPEIGHTLEAGINAKYDNVIADGDQLRAKFNVFQNDVTDYIGLERFAVNTGPCTTPPVTVPATPATCYQYINFANVLIRGIEFEGDYDAGNWFASASATLLEGTDKVSGDSLETILPFSSAVTLGARFLDRKLTVAPNWRYASADTTGTYGAYHVLGLTLAYEPNESTVASLVFDNILNTQYTQLLANNASPGISVKASLKVKLGQ